MNDLLLNVGCDRRSRDVLALGTGSWKVAAALLVGAQNFQDVRVDVMVIVSAVVGLGILLPTASVLGKHVGGATGVVSPVATERERSIKEKLV